ncbi:MAG: RNA polymerase sigma factor [Armatimonadota bacterium]
MRTLTSRLGCEHGHEVERLLRRCGAGDRRAWDLLLREVRRLALELGRWRYRLGQDEAEDMAQVVQLRVTQRLGQLREPEAFPLWVRRLVHHAAVDMMRGRKQGEVSLDDPQAPALEAQVENRTAEDYDRVLLRADLDRALHRLPDLYREPICLHLFDGLQQDEIGRLLGRPRSTVASQIERGLKRLERSLSGFAGTN